MVILPLEMVILWWFHSDLMRFTRPGKGLQFATLKITIEIVDLPINSMGVFHSYV
jgi:hypothetical protein